MNLHNFHKALCNFSDGNFYITVSDDGNGFSENALRHAAEPYFTEENKADGVHYGLGLAICKELCNKLGGKMSCSNNNGAIVKVEI